MSGSTSKFWSRFSICGERSQPGNPTAASEKRLPSEESGISSEKAKKILRHGSVRGHKLTKKQKGMFGAIAGSGD